MVFRWPALHLSYDLWSRLNSIYHCPWWWSVWKHRITGKLVFKFKKLSGFSGASSTYKHCDTLPH
jgi:hypothetical protein